MTKDLLLDILREYQKYDKYLDTLTDLLKCDMSSNIFSVYIEKTFNDILKIYYTSEGMDIIYYHICNPDVYSEDSMWEDLQSNTHDFSSITKRQFISYISTIQKFNETIDKLSDLLKYDNFEDTLISFGFYLFDKVIDMYFESEATNIIYWYLYDKSKFPDLHITSEDKELPTETIEDIWNIVKNFIK